MENYIKHFYDQTFVYLITKEVQIWIFIREWQFKKNWKTLIYDNDV